MLTNVKVHTRHKATHALSGLVWYIFCFPYQLLSEGTPRKTRKCSKFSNIKHYIQNKVLEKEEELYLSHINIKQNPFIHCKLVIYN